MDKETAKVLSDAEKLKNLTTSDGWSLARQMLVDRILDLQSIDNLDDTSAESMVIDAKARKLAKTILFKFLKEDIEGTVDQSESNKPKQLIDKPYLIRE